MYKEEEILKVLLLLFACKRKKMSGKKRKIKFWALGVYNTVISEYYSEDYTSYMRMNAESFPNK